MANKAYDGYNGFDQNEQRDPAQPEAPTTPTAPAPTPEAAQKPYWANYKPEDAWTEFLKSEYGAGQSARGAGFLSGGGAYKGGGLGGVIQKFNSLSGGNARAITSGEGDKVDFGQGAVDVITGGGDWWFGGPGANDGWNPDVNGVNHGTTGVAASQAGPGMTPGGGGAGMGAGNTSMSASSSATQGISKELYDMLLARAKQGTNVSKDDPNIRNQADPYFAQTERARRNYLADTAEKAGPLANIQGERRMSAERAGQANGLFESQLIGRELSAKRDEIQHALDSLRGQLSTDQQLALQKELAYLNDATQKYGIDANSKIAQGQLSLGNNRLGLDTSELDWRMDPRNPANLPSY